MSIFIYLATIFWSLFPNLIHVFQGGENYVIKVNETNLVSNGDFSAGIMDWANSSPYFTSDNGQLKLFANTQSGLIQTYQKILIPNEYKVYVVYKFKITSLIDGSIITQFADYNDTTILHQEILTSVSSTYVFGSKIILSTNGGIHINLRANDSIDLTAYWDYIQAFNVTEMQLKGVKNDFGISFTDLTDEEIKQQLDKLITNYGDVTYKIDNTFDKWFNTGFVEKTAERDFIDYLGYFFWLTTPPIILFATLDLIRRVI